MNQLPTISISEIFGPTIQGEGPDVGRPCVFLRVHNCATQCPGCDTYYTWDGSESGTKMDYSSIYETCKKLSTGSTHQTLGLVVSGGEPLLHYQSNEFKNMMWELKKFYGWKSLETSGYVGNKSLNVGQFLRFANGFDTICLSPKITPCLHGKQTDEELERNIQDFMILYKDRLCFKFVVKNEVDILAVLRCNDRHGFMKSYRTYLMPYGNDRDSILESVNWLVPVASQYGFIITPRLHSLLWGAKRGV